MKRTVRWTDTHRYKVPYIPFAASQKPGYLARRFDKLAPGWRTQQPREAK